MSKFVDLTNMRFGNLTVVSKTDKPKDLKKKAVYWLCKCDCGNESVVCTSNLKNGNSTRCWECAHYETNKHKRKDLTNQTFSELKVLEMIYPNRKIDPKSKTKCKCLCSCGNVVIRNMDDLIQNPNSLKSCGCKRHETIINHCSKDIDGKKFGRLTVLETLYDYQNHTKPKVRCLCECGNEVVLNKNDVQSGHTTSCGCLQRQRASESNTKDMSGYISDSGVKIVKKLYQNDKHVWVYECMCPICSKSFECTPNKIITNHTTSCGCKITSTMEKIVEKILDDFNLKYIKQYSFDDCKNKYVLKFDFAVFDADKLICLIETDGEQHYKAVDYFGGIDGLFITQKRYTIKNEYCIMNNIPLIRLPYFLSKEEIEKELEIIF
jgi:hypothetical protein